jgi:hypothetical protein
MHLHVRTFEHLFLILGVNVGVSDQRYSIMSCWSLQYWTLRTLVWRICFSNIYCSSFGAPSQRKHADLSLFCTFFNFAWDWVSDVCNA